MNIEPVLELTLVEYGWTAETCLLSIETFKIEAGESVFLKGPSGSGKSTLLGLIGGVLRPRTGNILIKGQDIAAASAAKRDRMRADHLGIIFQQFNLLPYLSVLGNITLPCRFSRQRRASNSLKFPTPLDEARHLVTELGLDETVLLTPVAELSVGQQQRVAAARALIGAPSLIIADEPTSALDANNRDRFIELLNDRRKDFGSSLLFVSHDEVLAKHFDRTVELRVLNRVEDQAVL